MKKYQAVSRFFALCAASIAAAFIIAGCANKGAPSGANKTSVANQQSLKPIEPIAAEDLIIVLDDYEAMAGFAGAKSEAWKKTLSEIIPAASEKYFARARFVKLSDLKPADDAQITSAAFYSAKKPPSRNDLIKLIAERKNVIFITNSPLDGAGGEPGAWSETAKQITAAGSASVAALAALLPFEGAYKIESAPGMSAQAAETFMKKDVFFKKFACKGSADFEIKAAADGAITAQNYCGAAAVKIYVFSLDGRGQGLADDMKKRAVSATDYPYAKNFRVYPIWPIDPIVEKTEFEFQLGYLNPETFAAAGLEPLGRKTGGDSWAIAASAINPQKILYAGGKLVMPKTKSVFYACGWDLTLKSEISEDAKDKDNDALAMAFDAAFAGKKQRSRIVEGALMQLAEFPKLEWKTLVGALKVNYYAICKADAAKSESLALSNHDAWSQWDGKDASNAPVFRAESSWAPYQLWGGDALAEEIIKSAAGGVVFTKKLPANILFTGKKK